MHITLVAGARPNFMKIAPIIKAITSYADKAGKVQYKLVHTGQHYDEKMSQSFFKELHIPEPHINLEVGSGTQAEQTAGIMLRFEKFLVENPTDLVMVVGDVTSTMACSIVAKKLHIKVAHVEGGIRSGDMKMPEEVNRIVTDSITDYFFTTTPTANANLKKEGVSDQQIFLVGNTMIDTLLANMDRFRKPDVYDELNLQEQNYFVITLHRPANVDGEENLRNLIGEIVKQSKGIPVVFPVHPRTAKVLERLNITADNLHLTGPLPYLEFNYLVRACKGVITDSGGITEETTVMNVPCLTLRNSTERPETVTIGTNELLGTDPKALAPAMEKILNNNWKKGGIPDLWDGHTAERIVEHLLNLEKAGAFEK